jgi:hypothetical protein
MNTRCNQYSRILMLAGSVLALAGSCAGAQKSYAVEGNWSCDQEYEGHVSGYRLEVKPSGPKKWLATRTLSYTDDPLDQPSVGTHSEGTIEVDDVYNAKLSGELGFHNWRGTYDGVAKLVHTNHEFMDWDFAWKRGIGDTVVWKERCWPEKYRSTDHPSGEVPPSTDTPATHPKRKNISRPQDEGNAAELLNSQFREDQKPPELCGRKIISTVFGYFEYDYEIDLSKGARVLGLKFRPYLLSGGSSVGQAIDTYAANAHLSLQPTLKIADDSILGTPINQQAQLLVPTSTLDWTWAVKQSWTSSASESSGTIAITITPAVGDTVTAVLPVKVIGKPWWWPLAWVWDNVLAKPEVSCVLLVFIVIAWRKGVPEAWRWAWRLIRHEA